MPSKGRHIKETFNSMRNYSGDLSEDRMKNKKTLQNSMIDPLVWGKRESTPVSWGQCVQVQASYAQERCGPALGTALQDLVKNRVCARLPAGEKH